MMIGMMKMMMTAVEAYCALLKRFVIMQGLKFFEREAKALTFPEVFGRNNKLLGFHSVHHKSPLELAARLLVRDRCERGCTKPARPNPSET
jgi:hypothetical protein